MWWRSSRTQQQSFVQTAGAITLEIEADIAIAGGFELADDRRIDLGGERARHHLARQLDARERVVVTHAEDAEAERTQRLLGALDRAQLLVGHFGVIRDARGQTRGSGLVPRRQPRAA